MSVLRQLAAAYPNSEVTKQTVAVYYRLLSDIPVDELQTIVDQCLHECRFLPTIAELRERHRDLVGGGLAIETAAEQWGQVVKAMREVGNWGNPNFTNPITAKVVSAMGWRDLCASENPMADRAHFLKMYQAIADRQEKIGRLTPASRQLAEQRGGLKPIHEILQLAEWKVAGEDEEETES